MTNIDECEIEQAFKTRIDLGEREKKYAEVEWYALDDKNNGNYKQPVRFDTTDLKDKMPIYREAYAVFPVKATSSGAAYTASSRLAFKCSVLSLIRTLMVQPTGQCPTLVSELDGQLPLAANLRLLTSSDVDWVECSGQELHYFGCDRAVNPNVMGGANQSLAPGGSHIASAFPTSDVYDNARLADRVAVFSAQSDHSVVSAFSMIISIPLKFISPFFDQCGFPLPNYPMRIQLGLSSLTNGNDDFMPITCPKLTETVGAITPAGAIAAQAPILPAPAPVLEIDTSIEIRGFAPGACRLYVKCVTLAGKDGEEMDKMLSSGYKKTITYLTSDIHPFSAVTTSANGSKYHKVFGENTKRPVRVWAMFPKSGLSALWTPPSQPPWALCPSPIAT
jgi:hypothetical protein